MKPLFFHVLASIGCWLALSVSAAAASGPFALDLPPHPVSEHITLVRKLEAGEKHDYAKLDGPGCIKRIWIALSRGPGSGREVPPDFRGFRHLQNRRIILRIYFDDATTPNVEAPIGDFFGMMHGIDYYEVNTAFLSVKPHAGYESYFEMPFATSARVEIANAPDAGNHFHIQVDWHRYPDQEMKEKRRFSAQWRREMPTPRYGDDYLLLDADGPGQLIGFFYGVRLIDNTDRWSHGGAENIYIDGLGDHPAYIRGLGGEDTFGTSFGGVLHKPESHQHTGMPYYFAEDTGEARSAQRVVGYRFYTVDTIHFQESLRFHFGCMENDICSMIYWYQTGAPRRFVKTPEWKQLLPATVLKGPDQDIPAPDAGSWNVGRVLDNEGGAAIREALQGMSADRKFTREDWIPRATLHGFLDFNHVHRPRTRGAGTHFTDKAAEAVAVLDAPNDLTARIRVAWDDQLVLRVNDRPSIDFGANASFRHRTIEVPLKKGRNLVSVVLTNTTGSNHGGWTFAFRATAPDGAILIPKLANPEPAAR